MLNTRALFVYARKISKNIIDYITTAEENHVELMKVIAGHVCVGEIRLIRMKNSFAFP